MNSMTRNWELVTPMMGPFFHFRLMARMMAGTTTSSSRDILSVETAIISPS
jgi:hypothetical protein